ncbi:hypothetical protein FVER53590_25771 [Fusarium verticillioides]|nr:hypothetical protein FVER53590_25771 [Fusarium verticillioides]
MKLTSWAICSVALAAGVFGADRPELFKNLPRCTGFPELLAWSNKPEISCLEKYNNSDLEAVDICNNEDVKRELDNCFADKCRDFERFDIAKIYANACDSKQKDNRNNHYVLLVVEIPAWIFPWLRLYLSWITYESLSLDDYVMVVCGLLYTVFATLVHFGGQRFSMISQLTGMIGIQVRTRTIRHVHDSGWDAEKGSARENIEAA